LGYVQLFLKFWWIVISLSRISTTKSAKVVSQFKPKQKFSSLFARYVIAATLMYHLMLVDLSLAAFVVVHQHGRHAIVILISRDWLQTTNTGACNR